MVTPHLASTSTKLETKTRTTAGLIAQWPSSELTTTFRRFAPWLPTEHIRSHFPLSAEFTGKNRIYPQVTFPHGDWLRQRSGVLHAFALLSHRSKNFLLQNAFQTLFSYVYVFGRRKNGTRTGPGTYNTD